MSHSVMTEMTKKLLSDSLKKLLTKKTLKKITVKDVVTDCRLTRQTFYYHFQDIYELLDWTFSDIIKTLLEGSEESEREEGYKKLFKYFYENKSLFISTLNYMGREHFENAIYPELFEYNKDYILRLSVDSGKKIPEKKINFLANLQTISLIAFLIHWLNSNTKQNLNEHNELIKMLDISLDVSVLNVLNEYEASS